MNTAAANWFYRTYTRLERSKLLNSIRRGFILLIPIFLVGAFALVIRNIPIESVDGFIETVWGGKLEAILGFIYDGTLGIAAVYIIIAVSYRYSQALGGDKPALNILTCINAVACFFGLLGTKQIVGSGQTAVLLDYLNVQSVFSALVTAILTTRLFLLLYRVLNRRGVGAGTEIDFKQSLGGIFPLIISIVIFSACGVLIEVLFHAENLNDLITRFFTAPFERMGNNLGSALLILFIQTLLWFFGIHGSNTFDTVTQNVFADGQGNIISKTFLDNFVLMGGCGTAVCLFLALLLFSKARAHRQLTKASAVPLCFNINEIIVFGLPVVLNPVMLVPFLTAPLVMLLTSYGAVSLGLVPAAANSVQWTTPLFFSGYLATGSAAGMLLQLFNIVIGTFVYMPFVKLSDKLRRTDFENTLAELTARVKEGERTGRAPQLLMGDRAAASAAKEISLELLEDAENGRIPMHFQPEMNAAGEMVSCEALLRWQIYDKTVYPPLLIALANEEGFVEKLNAAILETCLDAAEVLNRRFGCRMSLSFNLQSRQFADIVYMEELIQSVKKRNILPGTLGIEITEETELRESGLLSQIFAKLHEAGIFVSIDDFSMGHTSLHYLENNAFDTVKLDGSLSRNINNERSREIVQSISKLGKRLGFQVTAECVETQEQKKMLEDLGCTTFQGWLYAPALPLEQLMEFPVPPGDAGEAGEQA